MTGVSSRAYAETNPLILNNEGAFYVGGRYFRDASGRRAMAGQAYIEYQIPATQSHPFPVVMIPGGQQSGACFTATPDGREGWAQYFLRAGFAVYIMEQPGRGRSAYHPEIHGKLVWGSEERISRDFVAPERYKLYPQAQRHNQWPGNAKPGDPVYDEFVSSQLSNIADRNIIQRQNQSAGAALLDRIGPAILLTHSQSGTFGWLIADARPKLVKAIVAIEPGCPVGFIESKGPPDWFEYSGVERPWGLANIPLTYDPPVSDPKDLGFILQDRPNGPELARCWRQKEPARKLKNLASVPVVILSAEASFHTPYDHGTSAFLRQAGVESTHIQLADEGIYGNGHMMMLEKNSDEIAGVIVRWIAENVPNVASSLPGK